jgi:hypothetical protein
MKCSTKEQIDLSSINATTLTYRTKVPPEFYLRHQIDNCSHSGTMPLRSKFESQPQRTNKDLQPKQTRLATDIEPSI